MNPTRRSFYVGIVQKVPRMLFVVRQIVGAVAWDRAHTVPMYSHARICGKSEVEVEERKIYGGKRYGLKKDTMAGSCASSTASEHSPHAKKYIRYS